jgi:type IV secretory pathway VirB9-like protein
MKYLRFFMSFSALVTVTGVAAVDVMAQDAIVTDSRIKTLVYSPNDVFSLLMVYGYQSNIEFSEKEEIQTVSVGDRVGWQIVPAGHRLFIRPLEFGAHTNMTIITSKRSYQFDLRSAPDEKLPESEELVYVVRFFYPESNGSVVGSVSSPLPMSPSQPSLQAQSAPVAVMPPPSSPKTQPMAPVLAAPVSAEVVAVPAPPTAFLSAPLAASSPASSAAVSSVSAMTKQNFNYTYTGSLDNAPQKIYDDGLDTYVTLPKKIAGNDADVEFSTSLGTKLEKLKAIKNSSGVFVINKVLSGFTIKYKDGSQIEVFNESSEKNK